MNFSSEIGIGRGEMVWNGFREQQTSTSVDMHSVSAYDMCHLIHKLRDKKGHREVSVKYNGGVVSSGC